MIYFVLLVNLSSTRNNTNEDIPFSDGYKQYLWGLHNKAGKSYVEAQKGTTFNAVAEADVMPSLRGSSARATLQLSLLWLTRV